ncbi:hypothetical protein F5882DRAFT_414856 [Hyaloscypha sp. PMI_1271]|nr:hypothetical protein F5882DRAFT_414856 [Hyaloscypha sp. PMI_1271]
MLQKTLVLIPELLHFTAAVRWLSYHPHLASHRIALHYPGSRRSRGRGCHRQRLKDTVDAADWVRHGAFIINWERAQNRLVM